MTFFIDANVLVYGASADSKRAQACASILRAVAAQDAGGVTSTAALEEVWDLERRGRVPGLAGLTARSLEMLTPLLPITHEVFAAALGLAAPNAGTNDRLHLACCLVNEIEVIVSSDQGLDGPHGVERVDPLDDRAVMRLLALAAPE